MTENNYCMIRFVQEDIPAFHDPITMTYLIELKNWEATEEIATDIATDISGLKKFLDMAIFNGFHSYGDEEYKSLEKNYGNIVEELKHTEYLGRYEKASYEDKITWLVEYYGQVRVMYNVKHVVTGKCVSIK